MSSRPVSTPPPAPDRHREGGPRRNGRANAGPARRMGRAQRLGKYLIHSRRRRKLFSASPRGARKKYKVIFASATAAKAYLRPAGRCEYLPSLAAKPVNRSPLTKHDGFREGSTHPTRASIMRRRNGLVASSVMGMLLSWLKIENPSSQDRASRCAILSAVLPAAVPYRASGLVL
jgi:hypothetical protein